jgi:membrane-bound lytic murein transglycosylase A
VSGPGTKIIKMVLLITAMAMLTGCPGPPSEPETIGKGVFKVAQSDWPVLGDDLDAESLMQAVNSSRKYLLKIPADRMFQLGPDAYSAAHMVRTLDVFQQLYQTYGPGPELTKALSEKFFLYRSAGPKGQGKVVMTGYYEPLLSGSTKPDDRFTWPLYGRPPDLVDADLGEFFEDLKGRRIRGRVVEGRLKPYYTREQIDRTGALTGQGLEILWVDDPVALFFLHIQGSGRVLLPDGTMVRVGYAGANGHPYRSLGQYMMAKGLLTREEMSLDSIRDYLHDHPDEMAALLDYNPSYVFFHLQKGDVVGSLNVPLTPGRSVALDHQVFPKAALAWIEGKRPEVADGEYKKLVKFSRFVLSQDTGGAIKGLGRLDLFYGYGSDAEAGAGHMKEPGSLYFIVLKPTEKD